MSTPDATGGTSDAAGARGRGPGGGPDGGPLAGVRVVELAGLGPGPFAAMMLADMGADVVRIDRAAPGFFSGGTRDVVARGRRSIVIDLKAADGRAIVQELAAASDVLIEGFRPGVTERLGLGPDDCAAINPLLIYCRMTGWGQDGPLARTAGHDITYLARSGALGRFRRVGEAPVPPANLLGDFGGGAMFAVAGILAALVARSTTGRGQVVDTAIVDGVGYLSTFLTGLQRLGGWGADPGHNLLDTGAPYYEVYECADGEFVAAGALEDQFYLELLERSGVREQVSGAEWELIRPERRADPSTWTAAKPIWTRLFATRTRSEWVEVFAGSDACVEPVLSPEEARADDAARDRGAFVDDGTGMVPAVAPRLSETPLRIASAPTEVGAGTDAVLRELGRTDEQIAALRAAAVVH